MSQQRQTRLKFRAIVAGIRTGWFSVRSKKKIYLFIPREGVVTAWPLTRSQEGATFGKLIFLTRQGVMKGHVLGSRNFQLLIVVTG